LGTRPPNPPYPSSSAHSPRTLLAQYDFAFAHVKKINNHVADARFVIGKQHHRGIKSGLGGDNWLYDWLKTIDRPGPSTPNGIKAYPDKPSGTPADGGFVAAAQRELREKVSASESPPFSAMSRRAVAGVSNVGSDSFMIEQVRTIGAANKSRTMNIDEPKGTAHSSTVGPDSLMIRQAQQGMAVRSPNASKEPRTPVSYRGSAGTYPIATVNTVSRGAAPVHTAAANTPPRLGSSHSPAKWTPGGDSFLMQHARKMTNARGKTPPREVRD
jgi:hypothetical protein